jgi:hypothetical protein
MALLANGCEQVKTCGVSGVEWVALSRWSDRVTTLRVHYPFTRNQRLRSQGSAQPSWVNSVESITPVKPHTMCSRT